MQGSEGLHPKEIAFSSRQVEQCNDNMKTLFIACLGVLKLSVISENSARAADTRLFELRVYHAAPGKLDDLNARFRDHTLSLFEKHGMENIGYWVPADNKENKLVYILAYPSKEAHDTSWKAFK